MQFKLLHDTLCFGMENHEKNATKISIFLKMSVTDNGYIHVLKVR